MTCKYCDATLSNPRSKVCKARPCQNRGKIDRQKLRHELNPEKYASKPRQPLDDDADAPTELHYLDDEPGISVKELLEIHRDPVIRRKAHISRQIRHQKLLQRMNVAGLYDVIV